MRASFDQTLVAASAFLVFCSVGTGIFGAANASRPPVPSAAVAQITAQTADVNRINKGDQLAAMLHQLPVQQVRQQVEQRAAPPAEGAKASLQRPPLGCDGAFSPVADPARAAIYKRCTV